MAYNFTSNVKAISDDLGLPEEDLADLYSTYLEEMSENLEFIKKSLQEKNFVDIQKSVHTIKGMSANLGVKPVFEVAKTIDLKLKSNDSSNFDVDFKNLLNTFDDCKKGIISFYENIGIKFELN